MLETETLGLPVPSITPEPLHAGDSTTDPAALVERVPAILFEAADDDDRSIRYVGPQIVDALGYAVEEWLTQHDIWTELLHPDDREQVLARWDHSREGRTVFDAEYRLIGADGRRVWFHDRAQPTRAHDGTVLWHGVLFDVTASREREENLHLERLRLEDRVNLQSARMAEIDALIDLEVGARRATEASLREAEGRLAALKAGTRRSWFYTWDVVDGRATGGFNDDAALRDFGADPEEVARHGEAYWRNWFHPSDADRVTANIRRSTTTGAPYEDSYRWVTPDGRVRWILDKAIPTEWDAAAMRGHFVGLMVDVTDLMEGAVSPEA